MFIIKGMVFITGSSGFVGQILTSYLIHHQIKYVEMSRNNFGSLDSIFLMDVKIIIHLAGKAHDLKNTSVPEEYYQVNTELTKKIFDAFVASEAKVFITLSSVKAVADLVDVELTEQHHPNPVTHYGKSKLLAEQYILSKEIPDGKRVFILRPCMIHGPGNKGNLNILYKTHNSYNTNLLKELKNSENLSIINLYHLKKNEEWKQPFSCFERWYDAKGSTLSFSFLFQERFILSCILCEKAPWTTMLYLINKNDVCG